jgi:plasmid stabilization system protein ParE
VPTDLEWTEPALHALRALHDYIALDSRFYADRFIDRLTRAAEKLRDFPEIGREVPEFPEAEVRELVFQGYRIVYRLRGDRVQILTVVHGSRDLTRFRARLKDRG